MLLPLRRSATATSTTRRNPYPGGAGYMLSIARYTADSLVENNIFMNGNKVMVMRASGGGNVIGYNYFDNGYIDYYQGWMETGMNASHMTCPHFELFEGNQAFNIDGDDTWGGAFSITYFRNHATGKRRSFPDIGNRRAIGLMYGHYDYSFVGNVLGTVDQNPAPYSRLRTTRTSTPGADDPVGHVEARLQPRELERARRRRAWSTPSTGTRTGTTPRTPCDWETGYDTTLPNSLYLTGQAVLLRQPSLALGGRHRPHQALHASRAGPLRRREPERHPHPRPW